jgi:hypothetical protein
MTVPTSVVTVNWMWGETRSKVLTLDYIPGFSFTTGASAMQIGIVARNVGLSVDAMGFYERNTLLRRPARTQGAADMVNVTH